MTNNFTAVFQKTDDWWIGYVEELPGANTQGSILDEVRDNLKEAVTLILQANRELAEKQINDSKIIREVLTISGN